MATMASNTLVFVGYIDHAMAFDTAGEVFPLYIAYDPNATYKGTVFTCPATGWYEVTASVPVLGVGDAGAPAAGSAVSIQFESSGSPSNGQKSYTTSNVNVVKYRNIISMNAGDTKQLALHTDAGTSSTKVIPGNGFVEVMRVA